MIITNQYYRPEIDGIRAIAVLSVVLFHAGLQQIPQGYLGVDIFFVISGYLISKIIVNDIKAGQFSLTHFYERRIRRILPALVFVLITSTIVAWFLLLPHELISYGKSLFSIALFHSNFYFSKNTGYFDSDSQELPLIHTWPLSIEEQFYVVYPILLYFSFRYSIQYLKVIVFLLGGISFALFVVKVASVTSDYYLPHLRAWELLMGCYAAISMHANSAEKQLSLKSEVFSLAGLLLIIFGVLIKIHNPYGLCMLAFLVCLGTYWIIVHAENASIILKVLSFKPFVIIGLISYSAYLWHQPILAFLTLHFQTNLSITTIPLFLGVLLLLSWLSWFFIEQPFRNKNFLSKKLIYSIGCGSIALLASLGHHLQEDKGHIHRSSMSSIQDYAQYKSQNGWGVKHCEKNKVHSELGPVVCLIGDNSQRPSGVLWGDSIAGSLLYGLNNQLLKHHLAFLAVISNGCPPVEGLNHHKNNCHKDRHHHFVHEVIKAHDLKSIIWIGNFINAMNSRGTPSFIEQFRTSEKLVQESILKTATTLSLHNKKIYIMRPHPVMPINVPEFYMRSKLSQRRTGLMIAKERYLNNIQPFSEIENRFPNNVFVIDSSQFFCDTMICYARDSKDNLLYTDTTHFSFPVSEKIAQYILHQMDGVENKAGFDFD